MTDVLAHIVARTRADLDMRRIERPSAVVERAAAACTRRPHAFVAALGAAPPAAGVHLLAEFKPRSPSRGAIRACRWGSAAAGTASAGGPPTTAAS